MVNDDTVPELGASVRLAAETAIENPIDSVKLLKRFLKHTLKIKEKFYEENFNNGFTRSGKRHLQER